MTNRKYHILNIIFVICPLLSLYSCYPKDNHGFPKKVSFTSDGGCEIIKGDGGNHLFEIHIYEGKDFVDRKDSFRLEQDSLTYEWLTLRRVSSGYNEVELTASPNETNKKRSFTLELLFGDSWGVVTVTQKGL